jgi:hypothetical protein
MHHHATAPVKKARATELWQLQPGEVLAKAKYRGGAGRGTVVPSYSTITR